MRRRQHTRITQHSNPTHSHHVQVIAVHMHAWSLLERALTQVASTESDVHALWYAFANAESDDDVEYALETAEACGGTLATLPRALELLRGAQAGAPAQALQCLLQRSDAVGLRSWDEPIMDVIKALAWKPCAKRLDVLCTTALGNHVTPPCFGVTTLKVQLGLKKMRTTVKCLYCKAELSGDAVLPFADVTHKEAARLLFGKNRAFRVL